MNISEITKGVYYVGVNDRVTQRFEALWPLPYGVSYNSYIIDGGEEIALIDTVRIDEVREFLANVTRTAGGKRLKYLVINHMEPDHSGSIPELLRAYPEVNIVGNAQTLGMVRDFYHIDDANRMHPVKDGDVLMVGERKLLFRLTPMVHWPETMMTYLEDAHILFSGDAFGTFGALAGGVVDDEMDSDLYVAEMYRYYSNIVGKYGVHVQRALGKLQGLTLDYICSTHGPVWHSRLAEVSEIVDRLSRYQSEPGVTIVYGSMYGNTAEVAELIARRLCERGVKNIRIHNAAFSEMSNMISDAFRYEGLIVGSATYSMRLFPQVEAFLSAMETREVKGKVFASFGGYTWARDAAASKFEEFSQRASLPMVGSMRLNRSLNSDSAREAIALADTVADALGK